MSKMPELPPSLKQQAESLLTTIAGQIDAKAAAERVGYESIPLATIRNQDTPAELRNLEKALIIALEAEVLS